MLAVRPWIPAFAGMTRLYFLDVSVYEREDQSLAMISPNAGN
jgi:hypothetical protein